MIQDICVGNVLQPGAGAFMARVAMLQSGFTDRTAVYTGMCTVYLHGDQLIPLDIVNRQCSSGLQAIVNIANSIACGHIQFGIAAGVESMSQDQGYMTRLRPKLNYSAIASHAQASKCLVPMGVTR